jgi:DNA replication protein DnaC
MERMSDILARTADRRARQARPPADDCSDAGAGRVENSSSPRADAGAQTAAPRGVPRRPSPAGARAALGRAGRMPPRAPLSGPDVLHPSASTPGARLDANTRPDLREVPPGVVRPGAITTARVAVPDVQPAEEDDRILELPARLERAPAYRAITPATGSARRPQDPAPPRARRSDDASSQSASRPSPSEGSRLASGASRRAPSSGGRMRESTSAYAADTGASSDRAAGRPTGGRAPCPICGGAGYVRHNVPIGDPAFGKPVPCECKEREIEERRRSELQSFSSLDPFKDKTFESFDPAVQGVHEAFEAARAYAADPQGWLVLSGPHGVGKTHLAAAIANAHLAAGNPVFFSIVPDLLDHLRAAFAPTSEVPYDALFDRIREAGLLVLDDLGAENSTAWATEKLFQLINYRYNYRMPTVITTNNRLLSQMDERIRSRLADISLARQCAVKAQDYRERHVDRTRRPSGGQSAPRAR